MSCARSGLTWQDGRIQGPYRRGPPTGANHAKRTGKLEVSQGGCGSACGMRGACGFKRGECHRAKHDNPPDDTQTAAQRLLFVRRVARAMIVRFSLVSAVWSDSTVERPLSVSSLYGRCWPASDHPPKLTASLDTIGEISTPLDFGARGNSRPPPQTRTRAGSIIHTESASAARRLSRCTTGNCCGWSSMCVNATPTASRNCLPRPLASPSYQTAAALMSRSAPSVRTTVHFKVSCAQCASSPPPTVAHWRHPARRFPCGDQVLPLA